MEHPGPLAGVRVIDLTSMVMGPYRTQVMADMDADVIKIEPPTGDTTRYVSAAPEPGMGGLPSVQEQLTGEASYVGTIMADKVSGLTALYATMMALFHRERTGEGQEVEVPMFEAMAAFMLVEHANGALFNPPLQWNAFVEAVKPPWAGEHLATLEQRVPQLDAVYALLAGTFAERTTQEWLDLLRSLDIPAAPVRTLDELFGNPHLNAGPAPRLGAHTAEIMSERDDSSTA
jgi:crotonobetainyl-CoA:carnitine CoA-transferase CaiB-like acyl-CoA transferase